MILRLTGYLLLAIFMFAGSRPGIAQSGWKAEWAHALSQAKGQKLIIATHPFKSNVETILAFAKRHPEISVEVTQMSSNIFAPRVIREQQAGIFAWDTFIGQLSAVTESLLPSKGAANINDYLIRPDVKELSNYRAPQYVYSESGPYAFVYSLPLENAAWARADLTKGLDLKNPMTVLDPKIRGKLVIRTPDRATSGAVTLAALMRDMGPLGRDYVRRVLATNPTFVENPRQAGDFLMRGSAAILFGGEPQVMGPCFIAGACRNIVRLPYANMLIPRALIVLRNAPDTAATKVWVNWFLSKEGQEIYVREAAKMANSSAVSMRKDVAPAPGHEMSLPDYTQAGKYLIIGTKDAQQKTKEVMAMFRDAHRRR